MQGAPAGLYEPALHAVQLSDSPEPERAKPGLHRHVDAPTPLLLPNGHAVQLAEPVRL